MTTGGRPRHTSLLAVVVTSVLLFVKCIFMIYNCDCFTSHAHAHSCNLHHFVLNREPSHFQRSQFVIDEFHANSHKDCSINYNTSQFKWLAPNFSLCEQKNAPLAALSTPFSHMDQIGFLELARYKLASMNLYQRERNNGSSHKVFWRPAIAFRPSRADQMFSDSDSDSDVDCE